MPLFGTLDAHADRAAPAQLPDLDTEAWTLPGAEMLQLPARCATSTRDAAAAGRCIRRCRPT